MEQFNAFIYIYIYYIYSEKNLLKFLLSVLLINSSNYWPSHFHQFIEWIYMREKNKIADL